MKRMFRILLTMAIILPTLFFPDMSVKAKTLGDLKKELSDLEAQKSENEKKQQLTKDQINQISNSISSNTDTINRLSNEMIQLQEEIVQAEKDIAAKDKEIKELINFLQISEGESAYLEYAFGAKDFTDFIYRMAISEQLSSYNEELMKQHNELIENNNKKRTEITEKQELLRKKQVELNVQKNQLGNELKATSDAKISIDEEIRLQKTQVQYYEKLKCKDDETLERCVERNQVLPEGTAFYRPVVSGRITSEFGRRCFSLNGKYRCDLHGGIDMSNSGTVPIYAAAPGRVIGFTVKGECGGNMVYIAHNIKGKKYTSMYAHLRTITVKTGQIVTLDTQVGTMGGNPALEYWDACSTGQHLHFTLAYGHYLSDYTSWATFESNMFNPRIMLNAPASGKTFEGRNRKY